MENKFLNINKAPVRTKSWVGVNALTLKEYSGLELKAFNNSNVSTIDGVTIKKLNSYRDEKLSKELLYGVGEELTKEADENYNEGYIIKLEKDVELKKPVVIKYGLDAKNNTLVDNLNIIAEAGSKGTVIIEYKSEDNSEGYHNGLYRIVADKNSEVKVIEVNLLNNKTAHFLGISAEVHDEGKVDYVSIGFGGKYSVTNYHGDLSGKKSNSTIRSIYLGDEDKIIDINYIMTHKGKESTSNIITNGVLKDESKKTFKGTIDFKRGASKSEGSESEYCLLLSKKARSKAMPLLLCEEDEVSGEHAASSGSIDENKLFYLMSRGLDYNQARKVIVQGAFNPIVDLIKVSSIKEDVIKELDRRLLND